MTPKLLRCQGPCGRELTSREFPRYIRFVDGRPRGREYGAKCWQCAGDHKPQRPATYNKAGKYDAELDALVPVQGVPVTFEEIAERVGCAKQYIQFIAERALRKLRLRHPECAAFLEDR